MKSIWETSKESKLHLQLHALCHKGASVSGVMHTHTHPFFTTWAKGMGVLVLKVWVWKRRVKSESESEQGLGPRDLCLLSNYLSKIVTQSGREVLDKRLLAAVSSNHRAYKGYDIMGLQCGTESSHPESFQRWALLYWLLHCYLLFLFNWEDRIKVLPRP